MEHLFDGGVHRIGHREQREVLRTEQLPRQKLLPHEGEPRGPVRSAGCVHADDRQHVAFARLHERENLEQLVLRAESAGEQDHRMNLLHEHQLPCEEVAERDQLLILVDD